MIISKNEINNTVSAENQLKTSELVEIFRTPESVLKVLFVGNSITRHAPAPDIGWSGDWGMAATSAENDYVHLTVKGIEKMIGHSVDYGIAQASKWEHDYEFGTEVLNRYYNDAKNFNADIVIIRLGENMKTTKCQKIDCKPYVDEMIKFFSNGAEVIVTGGFWRNDLKDTVFRDVCNENGYIFCQISDLERVDGNLAIGQFWHEGVANHPSDKGMKAISDRLLECVGNLNIIKSMS